MDPLEIALVASGAVAVAGGAAVLLARDVVRAAVGLISALAGAAGVFLALGSEVVAALQVLIYVGGVVVLFLFALMVTPPDAGIGWRRSPAALGLAWLVVGAVAVGLLRALVFGVRWAPLPGSTGGTALEIGRGLILPFLLPFEMVSLLLLAGLIGAVVVIRKELR